MGQHFQKLADIEAASSEAPALAAELISWLIEAGIISGDANADCVLAGTGHPPGPRYHDAVTTASGDRLLSLRTNGVTVVTGRTVFHGDPGADVSCPDCGTPIRFAEVIAPAIGEWHAGTGNGSRPCPQCGTRHALNQWDWQPPGHSGTSVLSSGEAGEQLIEDLAAARVQAVQVPAVRHAPAVLAGRRQRVPLDHHHLLEPFGQHPGREQACHAGPENDRLITVCVVHDDSLD